jgi:site-specific DNA-methyltransferase (adenine-specific)
MDKVLHSSKKHDHMTPQKVLDLVKKVNLIRLDPCADKDDNNWFALFNFKVDGLNITWHPKEVKGLVYVNPPYGRELPKWVNKIIDEADLGAEIILLCPARPDTKWWHEAWYSANAFCFWKGRIKFVGSTAGAPFPSALFYWGPNPKKFYQVFSSVGIVGFI